MVVTHKFHFVLLIVWLVPIPHAFFGRFFCRRGRMLHLYPPPSSSHVGEQTDTRRDEMRPPVGRQVFCVRCPFGRSESCTAPSGRQRKGVNATSSAAAARPPKTIHSFPATRCMNVGIFQSYYHIEPRTDRSRSINSNSASVCRG